MKGQTDGRTGGQTVLTRRVAACLLLALLMWLRATTVSATPMPRPSVRLSVRPPDPAAILQRAAQAYQAIASFQADFRQTIADSMIGTYESSGRLTQAGTANLAMRFTDPKGEAIIMDGEYIWIFTPSTTPGQVIRTPIPKDATYGPNVLAWLLTKPTERYQSRYLRADAVDGRKVDVIELTPLDPSLPFTQAILWLDQGDSLPRKLEVQERTGTRRTVVLSKVQTNGRVAKDTFRFEVPPGTRIIEQ